MATFRAELREVLNRFWEDKVREAVDAAFPAAWIAPMDKLDKELCLAYKRLVERNELVEKLTAPGDFSPEAIARRKARDEAYQDYARVEERYKRRDRRREGARQLAVVEAAQKAGLPVKSATIGGVEMEFGAAEEIEKVRTDAKPDTLSDNPWDRVYAAE